MADAVTTVFVPWSTFCKFSPISIICSVN